MTLPVLPSQADVLLDHERSGNTSNNLGFILTFGPEIPDERIVRALEAAVSAFEAFRLRCTGCARTGYLQEIRPPSEPAAIELLDVSDADARTVRHYLETVLHRDSVTWDWQRLGVYRFRVLKAAGGVHHVAASLQHLAFDHRSVQIVFDSIRDYAESGNAQRRTITAPDDYAGAVRATTLDARANERALAYWENELSSVPAEFAAVVDSSPAQWHRESLVLDGTAYARFRERAGASPWGGAALLLERLVEQWRERHQSMCVIDIRLNCRPPRYERQVGMFATTRPLVFDTADQEWRQRVWPKLIRAAAHQRVDSVALRAIEEERGFDGHRAFPAFNYVVDADDSATPVAGPRGGAVHRIPFRPRSATYRPAGLSVRETRSSVAIQLGLNSRLFSRADVTGMLHGIARG
ncbi:condensation domain-containing protein [Nocardia asiatica]|uniref:condensation domain-containing protein n=1 Tax=Nocardia asiatica TaxID=209252 RepID=UPI003EE22D63